MKRKHTYHVQGRERSYWVKIAKSKSLLKLRLNVQTHERMITLRGCFIYEVEWKGNENIKDKENENNKLYF